ncbi:hypothetical protein AOQ84DRAFT_358288 [Glonium stellatum]|uniref:DUF7730 domain-containing protein n=1 Tax=Glonium stellatum TaxID=574774 RepID=A0A8E2FDE8_9PEZI|nr:hypothetical protein AOQ84DRAFT_358288 [Glonium stellatum]
MEHKGQRNAETPPEKHRLIKLHRNRLLNLSTDPTDSRMIIATSNSLNSPLLRLPAELRNQIFVYAIGGQRILISIVGNPYSETVLHTYKHPDVRPLAGARPYTSSGEIFVPISRTSRQIYNETALLPYKLNEFEFSSSRVMQRWMEERLPVQKRSISCIYIDLDHQDISRIPRSTWKNLDSLRMLCLSKRGNPAYYQLMRFNHSSRAEAGVYPELRKIKSHLAPLLNSQVRYEVVE